MKYSSAFLQGNMQRSTIQGKIIVWMNFKVNQNQIWGCPPSKNPGYAPEPPPLEGLVLHTVPILWPCNFRYGGFQKQNWVTIAC